jgi:hypothetical protein
MLSGTLSPKVTIQVPATPSSIITRLPETKTPRPPATQTSTALATPATLAQNSAFVFVSETIPDGTHFLPGQSFRKTWTIRNSGASAWSQGFNLVKASSTPANETLGALERIQLPKEVKPGETIQIGIDLTAPQQNGRYTVFYQLQDEKGSILPGSQIWVNITVGNVAPPASVGMAAGGINTANGVTATLSLFTSEAQSASVDFCMSVSFHQYTLVPAPSLLIDQKPAPFLTGSSHFESGPGCMEMTYQASAAEVALAQHITLLLDGSLRLLDALAVMDTQGVLAGVRAAAAGE